MIARNYEQGLVGVTAVMADKRNHLKIPLNFQLLNQDSKVASIPNHLYKGDYVA